ncbi:MAG TPA: glycosyltransferase family 4 protein [Candidatus Limnocylindria bacterium]|nr:glycosyltransferase family 4 protein [Candidatus Limnocylindria bacterium]
MTRGVRRILFVHYTTPQILGGVEQVMAAHAAALQAEGKEVAVLAGRGGATPRGVRVIRVAEADSRHPAVERDLAALSRGDRAPEHDALVARLMTKIRPHVERADRVVVHNVMTMPLNLALTEVLGSLARERPGRFIAWTHDISYFDERYAALRRDGPPWDLVTHAVPGVRYVTVSQERAQQLSQLTGLPRDDIEVVTNGIDVGQVLGLAPTGLRLAQRLGLFDADPLLLLPVRLTRRKRVEAAIDATAALRRRGHAAVLVVTGTMGPHNAANKAYLAELAARAKKVDGVQLLAALGLRINYGTVVDLYALADVLVFPSESEGFGIPMLEAGLHRMPIVCSDIPSLRETGGDDPIYVPPDASGDVIADAIERGLDTPVMRMRARAREHAWPRVLRERVLPVILGRAA